MTRQVIVDDVVSTGHSLESECAASARTTRLSFAASQPSLDVVTASTPWRPDYVLDHWHEPLRNMNRQLRETLERRLCAPTATCGARKSGAASTGRSQVFEDYAVSAPTIHWSKGVLRRWLDERTDFTHQWLNEPPPAQPPCAPTATSRASARSAKPSAPGADKLWRTAMETDMDFEEWWDANWEEIVNEAGNYREAARRAWAAATARAVKRLRVDS